MKILQYSSTRISLAVLGMFLIASIIIVAIVFYNERKQALVEAEQKAMIILNRNMATHAYFTKHLKPSIFSLTDEYIPKSYFDPVWMSSTYAIREIDKAFREGNGTNYYYKECAINARSPFNEADEYEREFIRQLNADPKLGKKTDIRTIEGKPYFVVLRRGEVLEETCMRCHSEPGKAPGGLVARYGSERSFHRNVHEVVSAISIRIPLEQAFATANIFALQLSSLLLLTLFLLFAVQTWIVRKTYLKPLSALHNKAVQIIESEEHLGEEIDVPSVKELSEVATAFNKMTATLRRDREQLEERVRERTMSLEAINTELQESLARVKTLSGMLPICASCKKIKDDKGYWSQVEVYISEHSEAEFSHGLCPECTKKAYEEFERLKNERRT